MQRPGVVAPGDFDHQPETIPMNTENETSQESKSYAAKPRSLKSVLKSMFPLRTLGFSKQARQARKEVNDEFWSEFCSLSGRSSRSEFWWTVGVLFIMQNALLTVGIHLDTSEVPIFVFTTVCTVGMVPVAVRRFHDTGKSGWWTILFPWSDIALKVAGITEQQNEIVTLVSLVCLVTGLIMLSLKGKPEKTRFDEDD